MTLPLSEFYPMLLPELPGIPNPVLDHHLRVVAREFCRTTSAWTAALSAINLIAGQTTYDLDSPDVESVVLRVTKMTASDILLWREDEPTGEQAITECAKYGVTEPPFVLSIDLKQITLSDGEVPVASVTGGLVLMGALQPAIGATRLPKFLLEVYGDAIRHGTLARLMVMGNKPWTDRQLAMDYQQKYNQTLGFAAYQAKVGNTRKPLRVKSWG